VGEGLTRIIRGIDTALLHVSEKIIDVIAVMGSLGPSRDSGRVPEDLPGGHRPVLHEHVMWVVMDRGVS